MVYHQAINVEAAIVSRADFIKYDTWMYFYLIGLALPIFHIIWLIDTCFPKAYSRAVYTTIFYGSLVLVLLISISMTIKIRCRIKQSGYFYCEAASTHMNISHFAVYVLDMQTCDRLAKEKAARWGK